MNHRLLCCRIFGGLVLAVVAIFPLNARTDDQPDTTTPPATVFAKQSTMVINYRERPRYPFDPQRLKRRPTLDGVIHNNEWDPLYTISGTAVNGTLYMNWDDDYLYLGARTDQRAWVIFNVDANADGWLRGADNLEITVAPVGESGKPVLTARILDAAGSRDTPVWNDRVVDPVSIQIAQSAGSDGQVLELAIPKGIAGLRPRANATLSLRGDFLPAATSPVPTAPYEPHLLVDVTLVEARIQTVPGIAARLTLEDNKLVPGQTLRATLELTNQVDEDVHLRAVTWKGEGAASELLRQERNPNLPTLKGLKDLKLKYSSVLPDTAIPGFYQVTATAELPDGRSLSSTASFAVVEPFNLQVTTESDMLTVLGPTELKVNVEIYSAVPGYARGDVEIQVPSGWQVKGRFKKGFYINRQDASTTAPFYLVLPSNTQAGEYAVHAIITWKGKTWKAQRTLHIHRPSETSSPKGS